MWKDTWIKGYEDEKKGRNGIFKVRKITEDTVDTTTVDFASSF